MVTCNFWGTPTSGPIPGGGAIVGWITDNAFKPEYTQNFTVFTANGQRCRFTVDPGGLFVHMNQLERMLKFGIACNGLFREQREDKLASINKITK